MSGALSASRADPSLPGVSFVIPVHNAARWLEPVIAAIEAQDYGGPIEILVVDDGSTDGSTQTLEKWEVEGRLRLLKGEGRGATAALNQGLRGARYPLVAQVDQDVMVERTWLRRLAAGFSDASVAAAQGHYVAAANADLWSRVMGLDLRQRYAALPRPHTNHVCTGNSVYRASALHAIGLFDETLGYGYDNDLSYRLVAAGYRLRFVPEATSVHIWRTGVVGYARQQYGFGYGRLDLLSKHRTRVTGDDVSPVMMMVQAPVTLAGCTLLIVSGIAAALDGPWRIPAWSGVALLGFVTLERVIAGVTAAVRFKDPAGFWFGPVHMLRNLSWALAIVVWTTRRLVGQPVRPAHSMRPRTPDRGAAS